MARDPGEDPTRKIPVAVVLQAAAQEVSRGDGGIDTGNLEAQSLNRGLTTRDLKRETEEREHDRSQAFKGHFELMAIIAFWVMFLVFIAVGSIWALHLIVPQWGWLKHDQTDDLQGLLTGGVIAGVLADHVRRRMN